MVRNFNHGPRHWTSIEVLWKEFKIRAKVELDYTIWLIWKSIHWGSWVVATTIQILESNPLADPIFEERYLTSCTDGALFAHKVNNDPSDEKIPFVYEHCKFNTRRGEKQQLNHAYSETRVQEGSIFSSYMESTLSQRCSQI
jgi:hypothetical protein